MVIGTDNAQPRDAADAARQRRLSSGRAVQLTFPHRVFQTSRASSPAKIRNPVTPYRRNHFTSAIQIFPLASALLNTILSLPIDVPAAPGCHSPMDRTCG
jgi:hypothetical protein